ncbi:tetratricopeptide repeat protein [Bradymonas sediminis]|uniref:tetratricopeptide repeat protein n=1 Tax=Bradymonas sediminis TaxID=1548548 RepID=UPI00105C6A6A|nr:tetratricopeptide repeat protein [Bradymonas sediminis]TDP64515.1 hypothetical protein DFR33_109179 [Bradymonas sediminis]
MLSTKTRALAAASIAFATYLCAPPVYAQDGAPGAVKGSPAEDGGLTYKEYANQGAQAFAAKQYAQAAEAFERAYELNPVPNLLYNIGRAREKLGLFESANAAYTQFVTQPDVELKARQDALQRIKTLKEVIALQKGGEVVDAGEVDREQGDHGLAEAPEMALDEATSARIAEALAEAENDRVQPGTPPLRVSPPAEATEAIPTTAYILMGTGAASLIGSGVFGYLTYAQSTAADDATTLDARRDENSTGQSYAYVADGMLVGGVILAGLGTYFWLSSPSDSTTSAQARVTPSIGASGAALTFTLDY